MYLARVHVTLKTGVMDPQGEAVKQGLLTLGYQGVKEVRVGKYLEVRLEAPDEEEARHRAEEMCRRLLANPVLEDYIVEVAEG
ncbi:MAG: phosphoribosylformylglycinamidine synthase subunit PurS [Thermoanaerobacteraceae bacterium]|uniref:phosphoribosylformylglycinamidine synthase subunit PurS n=1 Tax=Thermanaeromonas sp. C210 TaxID=2731925 RepID=UPI0015646A90|nr:phosphoribosylformylglycinamidine synthase subunit PurS [Thermoanaerobacteraceae bacterium]